MRFLSDESCDAAVVRALRNAGHDVKVVADTLRGATDSTVLNTAVLEGRLLLTEDKDFGDLVFAAGASAIGNAAAPVSIVNPFRLAASSARRGSCAFGRAARVIRGDRACWRASYTLAARLGLRVCIATSYGPQIARYAQKRAFHQRIGLA